LPQKKPQLFLSSSNCDIAEAEGKLRLIASETKTSILSMLTQRFEMPLLSASGKTQKVFRGEAVAAGRVLLDQDGRALLLVPSGKFQMGSFSENDAPVHSVNVSPFFMGEMEVTYGEWKRVMEWAEGKGYNFKNRGRGVSDKHPVTDVSWYDVLKWCNAKCEMERLAPCYKVGGNIYREGEEDKVICDWDANGYRLPTEAEWEKAARGGLSGEPFPNGDTLEKKDANFNGSGTMEVCNYPANGYGLYDMAGNVSEWCWDAFWEFYYKSGVDDPKGYDQGYFRVHRGGSFLSDAARCRSAYRISNAPDGCKNMIGFRLARVPSR
jgi:hypothetical protein